MHIEEATTRAIALLRDLGIDAAQPRLIPRTSGRSGASTFEVHAGDRSFVLKVEGDRDAAGWRQSVEIQRLAAAHDLAPQVHATDEATRSVLSAHVAGLPLSAALAAGGDPSPTLVALAEAIAGLHGIAVPPSVPPMPAVDLCRDTVRSIASRFPLPRFAAEVWEDFLARDPRFGADELCHHDLNPTNILVDGTRVCFVDWQTAGRGDGTVDLATIVNMLLLDGDRGRAFLDAYLQRRGRGPLSPEAITAARRVAYVAYGLTFLDICEGPGPELERTALPSLSQCYAEMARGTLDMATDDGKWRLAAANFAGYWDLR